MTEPTDPGPRPKGIPCEACRGCVLRVYRTARPCLGVVVRYRACGACGTRTVTAERAVRTLPPPAEEVRVQN